MAMKMPRTPLPVLDQHRTRVEVTSAGKIRITNPRAAVSKPKLVLTNNKARNGKGQLPTRTSPRLQKLAATKRPAERLNEPLPIRNKRRATSSLLKRSKVARRNGIAGSAQGLPSPNPTNDGKMDMDDAEEGDSNQLNRAGNSDVRFGCDDPNCSQELTLRPRAGCSPALSPTSPPSSISNSGHGAAQRGTSKVPQLRPDVKTTDESTDDGSISQVHSSKDATTYDTNLDSKESFNEFNGRGPTISPKPTWTAINHGHALKWDDVEQPMQTPALLKPPKRTTRAGNGVTWDAFLDPIWRYDTALTLTAARKYKAWELAESRNKAAKAAKKPVRRVTRKVSPTVEEAPEQPLWEDALSVVDAAAEEAISSSQQDESMKEQELAEHEKKFRYYGLKEMTPDFDNAEREDEAFDEWDGDVVYMSEY